VEEIDPNEEFITSNYGKTIEIVKKQNDPNLLNLLEALGDRYAIAPASARKEYHSAFPGGLCYHNLNVLKWIGKFAQTMTPGRYDLRTLIRVGILHDLGKVGDMENDYYLPQQSSWHRDKGIFYETNRKIDYMRVPHRSLFLAQLFDVNLCSEEYLAIMLHDGQFDDANKNYAHKEPDLAVVLHFADYWASRAEKTNKIAGW